MTSSVTEAHACCNGEVAYIAWAVDKAIPGCLGFMLTRVHETGPDAGQRRNLPSWIAFADQSNPEWLAQDTSVWPVQNFEWRDLTLRRSRDTTSVRPIDFDVHYEIQPVGQAGAGRPAIPASATAVYKDAAGTPRYTGTPRPLFAIGDPKVTASVQVTHSYGPTIEATFTNGILSTQNLLQQLASIRAHAAADAVVPMPTSTVGLLAVLKKEIADAKSSIRAFLTADALAKVRLLVDQALAEGGELYAALYELHDAELIGLLTQVAKRGQLQLILSTAGSERIKGKGMVWDTENDPVRKALHAVHPNPVTDRMFNNATAIGHDKFIVYVKNNTAQAVMTGSTNWTETGLCTQSNNVIILREPAVAKIYWDFWNRLKADRQPARVPASLKLGKVTYVGAAPNNANQGATLRSSNGHVFGSAALADGSGVQVWFSPSTTTNKKTATSPMPGDLKDVYALMNGARQAIFFLTFMPGQSGQQNIIGEAAKLAAARSDLLVLGAISDPRALPNFVAQKKGAPKPKVKIPPPSLWWPAGDNSRVAMIRASAITTPVGDLHPELLTAGHAIIHDKIIVIDPLDPAKCALITGSHNLGYKASYDNDENLLIIQRNSALATAYAVHVLDVYQHYLMRAKLEDQQRTALLAGKKAIVPAAGHGFLETTDAWQGRFFVPMPANARDYFLGRLKASAKVPGEAVGLGASTPAVRKAKKSKSARMTVAKAPKNRAKRVRKAVKKK